MQTILTMFAVTFWVGQGCGGSQTSGERTQQGNVSGSGFAPFDSFWTAPSTVLDLKALPLGNGKYVTSGAKKGYVYACDARMYQFSQIIGARVTGPWVNEATTLHRPRLVLTRRR